MSKAIDELDTNKKGRFIEVYSQDEVNGNVSLTCSAIGISRQTYYDWLENDEEFRGIIKERKLELCDKMEQVLISRAVDQSDTALIFWLKNNHEGYRPMPVIIQQFNAGKLNVEWMDGTAIK